MRMAIAKRLRAQRKYKRRTIAEILGKSVTKRHKVIKASTNPTDREETDLQKSMAIPTSQVHQKIEEQTFDDGFELQVSEESDTVDEPKPSRNLVIKQHNLLASDITENREPSMGGLQPRLPNPEDLTKEKLLKFKKCLDVPSGDDLFHQLLNPYYHSWKRLNDMKKPEVRRTGTGLLTRSAYGRTHRDRSQEKK